jgi:hypothetical protein
MTNDEGGNTENEWRLRHLADIQVIVGRLSQHSFVIRGWSVTLVSVMFAIIASQGGRPMAMILFAMGATLIFWALDAFYLRRERLFRYLYKVTSMHLLQDEAAPELRPFDMDVQRYVDKVPSFAATLFTGHVVAIPAMLTTLIITYFLLAS